MLPLADAGVTAVTNWSDAEAVVVGLDRRLSYERLAAGDAGGASAWGVAGRHERRRHLPGS